MCVYVYVYVSHEGRFEQLCKPRCMRDDLRQGGCCSGKYWGQLLGFRAASKALRLQTYGGPANSDLVWEPADDQINGDP